MQVSSEVLTNVETSEWDGGSIYLLNDGYTQSFLTSSGFVATADIALNSQQSPPAPDSMVSVENEITEFQSLSPWIILEEFGSGR